MDESPFSASPVVLTRPSHLQILARRGHAMACVPQSFAGIIMTPQLQLCCLLCELREIEMQKMSSLSHVIHWVNTFFLYVDRKYDVLLAALDKKIYYAIMNSIAEAAGGNFACLNVSNFAESNGELVIAFRPHYMATVATVLDLFKHAAKPAFVPGRHFSAPIAESQSLMVVGASALSSQVRFAQRTIPDLQTPSLLGAGA